METNEKLHDVVAFVVARRLHKARTTEDKAVLDAVLEMAIELGREFSARDTFNAETFFEACGFDVYQTQLASNYIGTLTAKDFEALNVALKRDPCLGI
jgi:hypothetical protein